MTAPQAHRRSRIKRRYAGIVVLCLWVVWLVPVAYGQADQVSRLIVALEHARTKARRHAAGALGETKDPRAIEPLIAAFKDSDVGVRMYAAQALGEIGAPAVGPLIAALEDSDKRVRRNAAVALGCMNHPRAVEPLIAALKNADASVRGTAAYALGETQDPRAAEALVAALKEPDLAVTAAAYQFFIRRGEPGTEDALIQALQAYGTGEMGFDFLNCGNSALEAAARTWASKHGLLVVRSRTGGPHPHWGERP